MSLLFFLKSITVYLVLFTFRSKLYISQNSLFIPPAHHLCIYLLQIWVFLYVPWLQVVLNQEWRQHSPLWAPVRHIRQTTFQSRILQPTCQAFSNPWPIGCVTDISSSVSILAHWCGNSLYYNLHFSSESIVFIQLYQLSILCCIFFS